MGSGCLAAPPYLSSGGPRPRGGKEDAAAERLQEEFERRHLRAVRLSERGADGRRAGPGRRVLLSDAGPGEREGAGRRIPRAEGG